MESIIVRKRLRVSDVVEASVPFPSRSFRSFRRWARYRNKTRGFPYLLKECPGNSN